MNYTCEYCKLEFKKRSNSPNKFCSRKCFMDSVKKKHEVICSVCDKKYTPKNRQTSPSIKHFCPDCRGMSLVECSVCSKEFKVRNSSTRARKNTWCSVNCKAIGQRKDWNNLTRNMLKQRYKKELGNLVCRRCGHDKEFNIVIHHKRYVRNGGDNMPENLEPLCLNCYGIEHYQHGKDND